RSSDLWLKTDYSGKILPDWKVIAHAQGGQAAIYTRDPKLNPRVVALLKKYTFGSFRILERAELDRLEAFPGAVCAIDAHTTVRENAHKISPGYAFTNSANGRVIASLG